jgi:glycosyltransferase involved in cell wall biosynthesis
MADGSSIRVVFNNRALLFGNKTGIGYYICNLYNGLLQSEAVVIRPTIANPSSNILRLMSNVSQLLRRVTGDSILKISVPVGKFLMSKRKAVDTLPEAEIYHETNYDEIPAGKWKTLATVHDLAFVKHPEYFLKDVRERLDRNFHNILKADRFIVTTEAIRNELMDFSGVPEGKIDVIPLAPSGNYHPVDKELREGKENADRYAKGAYILYAGTLEPRKNIHVLMNAFSLIRNKFKLKLVLVGGKGWLYDEILKMPEALGLKEDIIFTGYVSEERLLYLYNYASVFVYPSLYEGFGIPVIEAMSCGVPVVVSDIPSLREVSGGAAMVFNPSDHEELACRLEQILGSESIRRELCRKSLRRAGDFSWKKVVASTIHSYHKALED